MIEKTTNPADYFMKHFYVPYLKKEEDIKRIENLNDNYQSKILPSLKMDMNGFPTQIDIPLKRK